MLIENELLLEAVELINSKEDQIAEIESDVATSSQCGPECAYGRM